MSRKTRRRIFFVLLIGGIFIGLTQSLSAMAETPALQSEVVHATADIEPELLNLLTTQGTANFFIVMDETADLSAAYDIGDWSERGWYVYNTLLEVARRTQAPVIQYAETHGLDYRSFYSKNAVYIMDGTLSAAEDLATFVGVSRLQTVKYAHITPQSTSGMLIGPEYQPETPNAYGWNLDTLDPTSSLYGMQAAQVWGTYGVRGNGIVVANIDTGVYYEHEALVGQYRGNLGGSFDHDFNWYMPTSGCGDGTYPCDNHGHGSGTMGIMVGEKPDLTEQVGVAPGATWIACKGCEGASCSDPALIGCADWMIAPCPIGAAPGDPSCDPDMRPQIINNSWGGGGGDNWYQSYVQAWVAAGMFPAFSAGNASTCNSLGSPGDYPESFGTAAHDTSGDNYYAGGPSAFYPTPSCDPNLHEIDPHLNAPTFGRTSGNTQGTYYNLSGTSGATPHTAGTVALIWSINPAYIGDIPGTFYVLEQSANHDAFTETTCGKPACAGSNTWPNYDYGWGYLDALAAVEMVGASSAGYLDGYVYDEFTSDPIEGASVNAVPSFGIEGGTIEASTDPSGYYSMTLVAGTYNVTADYDGYGPETVMGVEVVTGTVTSQDFYLRWVGGEWLPGPSPAPFEFNRFDGVFNPHDELIYFLGGRTGSSTHDPSIWTYDPRNDNWVDTTCDMLYNAANITIALIEDDGTGRGEALYVVGGYDVATASNIDNVQRYYPSQPGCVIEDVVTDPYPDTNGSNIIGAGGVEVVDDKIYVFGGWENVTPFFSGKTWKFDPQGLTNNRWSEITTATLNPPRAYINTAVQNGLIYAMGGHYQYTGSDLVPTAAVEVFNPANPAAGWVTLASLPVATGEGRGFGFNTDTMTIDQPRVGKIYVAGGGDWPDQSNVVYEYDVATNTWDETFPDLIQARRGHAGVFVPICTNDPMDGLPGMWVFGGRISTDVPPFGGPEYYAMTCPPDLQLDAPPLQVIVPVDGSATIPISITNAGYYSVKWVLSEAQAPIGNVESIEITPRERTANFDTEAFSTEGILTVGGTQPNNSILDAGDVIQSWAPTEAVTTPWGIAYDSTSDSVWVSEGWGNDVVWEYAPDGTYTGRSWPYTWSPTYGPADLAYNWNTGMFWAVDVGGDDCIHEIDPASGVTGNTICSTAWSISQRGVAYDPLTDSFFVGSWNDNTIYHIDSSGTLLESWPFAGGIAGLAYNFQNGILFIQENSSYDTITVVDVANWTIIDSFTVSGFGGYSGAGLGINCDGNLWAVDQVDNIAYLIDSGVPASLCEPTDIPWLSENPTNGTLGFDEQQAIDVNFDATGMSVGEYYAQLMLFSNDPKEPLFTLPVTMTVIELKTYLPVVFR